jgi:hypothetical protein
MALRRIEHRPPQAGHVVEECRPNDAAVVDVGHFRLVSLREGRGVSVPRPPRRFVNIDEDCGLGRWHARLSSRPMRAGDDNFKSLVPQEVGGQVVPFDVGLLKPGDSQVEAAFGHPSRLRV